MPNTKGGKKYKKRGAPPMQHQDTTLPALEGDQLFGVALRLLGNRRVQVMCHDSVERICLICGSMRKHVWVAPGDMVIISLRTEDGKGDIIGKLNADQEKMVRRDLRYASLAAYKARRGVGITATGGGAADDISDAIIFETEDKLPPSPEQELPRSVRPKVAKKADAFSRDRIAVMDVTGLHAAAAVAAATGDGIDDNHGAGEDDVDIDTI